MASLSKVSVTCGPPSPEADDPPEVWGEGRQPRAHVTVPVSVTAHHLFMWAFIISGHHKKGGYSILRHFESESITFTTVYRCNCSISFLVIVNLLLYLTYKLNFIIGMYVEEKSTAYVGFSTVCSFRHPLGVWECLPCG